MRLRDREGGSEIVQQLQSVPSQQTDWSKIMRRVFPFSAILGQDRMKNALIWNVVNPHIGGALFSGQKGTAKSTLVRALAQLLRDIRVVELPLNVTEDRLVGTIDIQAAIRSGQKCFDPGILSKADGQLLYIDEVNLLSDHIVNCLLETAASGVNRVEREGISYAHSAKFVLIGSMNPEEGKLRPQFLDRFGLYVNVEGCNDEMQRVEIMRRRLEYEREHERFTALWEDEDERLRARIQKARSLLEDVKVSENTMRLASSLSAQANCPGQRAELVITQTARAIAALDGRTAISLQDIRTAAEYALPHRRRDPEQQMETPEASPENGEADPPENVTEDAQPPETDRSESTQTENRSGTPQETDAQDNLNGVSPEQEDSPLEESNQELPPPGDDAPEAVDEIGETFEVRPRIYDMPNRTIRKGSGRRSLVRTSTCQGRYIRAILPRGKELQDIAFDATLRAAAPHQSSRDKHGMALAIENSDVRTKLREKRTGNTILFVVDASGSMGANKRMQAVKGAVYSLLNDAYQKRDKVGMIVFRKQSAELILGITRSVDLAQKQLKALPTGGRTPLSDALMLTQDVLRAATIRDKDILPVIVLISDGRANASKSEKKPVDEALQWARKLGDMGAKCIVIDTENDFIRLKLAEKLAEAMGADYFRIEDLNAEVLTELVSHAANH